MSGCDFTYAHYRSIFETALDEGYQVVTVADWFRGNFDASKKVLVNRVDVDANIGRLARLGDVFKAVGVPASIFLRLHGPAYNLFFFDNVSLARRLAAEGHEIGLHTEIEDVRHLCGIDPEVLLRGELDMFAVLFGRRPVGAASHGSRTPYNNLDFWKERDPADFGLLYEAYDERLWTASRYVSDSEYTRWKAYENGALRLDDRRCACEHIREGAPVLYLLTHTCSWYDKHIYEQTL